MAEILLDVKAAKYLMSCPFLKKKTTFFLIKNSLPNKILKKDVCQQSTVPILESLLISVNFASKEADGFEQ